MKRNTKATLQVFALITGLMLMFTGPGLHE